MSSSASYAFNLLVCCKAKFDYNYCTIIFLIYIHSKCLQFISCGWLLIHPPLLQLPGYLSEDWQYSYCQKTKVSRSHGSHSLFHKLLTVLSNLLATYPLITGPMIAYTQLQNWMNNVWCQKEVIFILLGHWTSLFNFHTHKTDKVILVSCFSECKLR